MASSTWLALNLKQAHRGEEGFIRPKTGLIIPEWVTGQILRYFQGMPRMRFVTVSLRALLSERKHFRIALWNCLILLEIYDRWSLFLFIKTYHHPHPWFIGDNRIQTPKQIPIQTTSFEPYLPKCENGRLLWGMFFHYRVSRSTTSDSKVLVKVDKTQTKCRKLSLICNGRAHRYVAILSVCS